jgi:hypothetical protein
VPDPTRVFAALFVLGSVQDPHWLRTTRELFTQAVLRNQDEMVAAIEALSLCPQTALAPVLTPLLTHEQARLRVAALRVLSYRGELPQHTWQLALADADPTVVAAAAWAPLHGYEPQACTVALAPLLAQGSETLTRLALRAGLSLRLRVAYEHCHALAPRQAAWADALQCLAMFGFASDAELIERALAGPDVLSAARAAGFLGDPALVPALIQGLANTHLDPRSARHLRIALWRITGMQMQTLVQGPEACHEAQSLWAALHKRFTIGQRYRHGQPLTPAVLLDQLHNGPGQRLPRQDSYLELMAITQGGVPRLNVFDFVSVQSQSLRAIDQWLASPAAHAAGTHGLQ